MPSITLKLKYGKNNNLIINSTELLEGWMHGISICDQFGRPIPVSVIEDKIRTAQNQIENTLSIKLTRQVIVEEREFIRDEYGAWGYIRVTYPPTEILKNGLVGFLNGIRQIEFPDDWISLWNSNKSDLLNKNIHLVPTGSSANVSSSVVYAGITPHLGFFGLASIPNYWNIKYCTGFDGDVPDQLREFVGKLATLPIFNMLGDIVLGAGIASSSLSVDGLSQSINTTSSAENSAYSARIKQYMNEMKDELPNLVNFYKGITFMAM